MSNLIQLLQENQRLKNQLNKLKQINNLTPYINDNIIKGGYHVVKTIVDRDNIDCCYRKLGMKVLVVGDDLSFKEYILKTDNCKENIWGEVDVKVEENEVFLIEDYSELSENLKTQKELNLILKQLILDLQTQMNNIELIDEKVQISEATNFAQIGQSQKDFNKNVSDYKTNSDLKNQEQDDRLTEIEGETAAQYESINNLQTSLNNKLDKGTYTGNAQDLKDEIDNKTSNKYNDEANSIANDITKLIDINTGENVNYREVTTWYDGTPMDDSKVDGYIFKKINNKYVKRQIDKNTIIKINTIADLRNFNGYYQGQEVVLIGYYNAGDKEPRIYKFSSGTSLDDGGQTINTSKGKWELLHIGELNVEDYGVFGQREENDVQFQKLLNNNTVKVINFNSVYKFTGSFSCNNSVLFTSKKKDNKITFSHTTSVATFTGTGNIALENINIDYDNKHCLRFFLYAKNLGKVSIKNVTFSNVNDDDSTKGIILLHINAEGNVLDLDNITFNNFIKLGNGSITDSSGSLNLIYITTDDGVSIVESSSSIKNIFANNIKNVNGLGDAVLEDTTVVYIASYGRPLNILLQNINGYQFGKRLIKIQASNVIMHDIYGYSDIGDSLSVVGIGSEGGWYSENCEVINAKAEGNIDYAFSNVGNYNFFSNITVKVNKTNALNNGVNHFGLYLSDSRNCNFQNLYIECKRPICLSYSTNGLEDIVFDGVKVKQLETTLDVINFTNLDNNASLTKGMKNITCKNFTIILSDSVDRKGFFYFEQHKDNIIHNGFSAENITFVFTEGIVNNVGVSFGRFSGHRNLKINNVKYINKGITETKHADLLFITNCEDVFIDAIDLYSPTTGRTIYLDGRVSATTKSVKRVVFGNNMNIRHSTSEGIGFIVISEGEEIYIPKKYNGRKIIFGTQTTFATIYKHFGTTAQKPTPKVTDVDYEYYDTTLGRKEVWSGTTWQVPLSSVPNATTSTKGVVNQAVAKSNSTATDVPTLVTDFNDLLSKLRSAGIIAP